MKSLWKCLMGHNSGNIWYTVTSKYVNTVYVYTTLCKISAQLFHTLSRYSYLASSGF